MEFKDNSFKVGGMTLSGIDDGPELAVLATTRGFSDNALVG